MSRQLANNRNIKQHQPQQQQPQQQPQQLQQSQIISSRIIPQQQSQQILFTNNTVSNNIQITNLGNSGNTTVNSGNSFVYYTTPHQIIQQPQQQQQQPMVTTPNLITINLNATQTVATTPTQIQQLQIQTQSVATPTTHLSSPSSPIAKKRLKLDTTLSELQTVATVTTATTTIVTTNVTTTTSATTVNCQIEDLGALKKRILEHKYQKLKSLKDKFSENVEELFFLQNNGNMMDYPTWRKRAPFTPQFINFCKAYKLGSSSIDDFESDLDQSRSMNQSSTSSLPQGAEIKIPGVGVTPIAVSTKLPAAVAQLNQQGQIPGRPQGGRHGMIFGQISVPSTIGNSNQPLVPGGTPLVPDSDKKRIVTNVGQIGSTNVGSTSGITTTSATLNSTAASTSTALSTVASTSGSNSLNEIFSDKAKQEVYVLQRVQELQREGLWMEKRLPKLAEPSRQKAHWDYLLEEMQWLAVDFAQERKWKKAAAKKCARMVQKYFQDKQLAAQKAEKAQEQHLKRIAAFIAKEIKQFWSNVEKLVEYKQQTKLEEKRKKVLDQQLSFIVDQTEKYSQQLAEGMNKGVAASKATSLNSSRIPSPAPDNDFQPNEDSEDDEETIAQAEAEIPSASTNEEVNALKKESEMELDDFLKSLPKGYLKNRDKIVLSESESENKGKEEEDSEFQANEDSSDDEDTIMEQEKNEKGTDHKAEIDDLNAENEMSIDELRAKYQGAYVNDKIQELDSDDDSIADESSVEAMDVDSDEDEASEESEDETEELGLENLLVENQKTSDSTGDGTSSDKTSSCDNNKNKEDLFDDVAALAESIQPKGNTLSSTSVVTPIPFLLKHSLREYQHIGLDWLVTMHERKLNGILADEMGLGKTIQTIALLAHLACVKGNWGPHLIIVPSSVMLNWEMEFKKWCPGFKILTYYGSQKERKMKRIGWTKRNAFHVCITSYKLVIQDHQSFRRKKWKYLILDEAQNIKNFKSQRWQLLLNFVTEQRLLLTGTPLQNNLMELWSLMHFLMPNVFQSHREFKEWFSNPVTGMIEGNSEYNESIIIRLHKVLRPFLLRRLKCEVEKQMPKKYEHVIMCRLSKRQRFLYDDFMNRAKTKETLATGNLLSVINVLMQLRKVCNHPNLFEGRPTVSPFRMDKIDLHVPSCVYNIFQYDPLKNIDLQALNLILVQIEDYLSAFVAYRIKRLVVPKKLIEEIDSAPELPPRCPPGQCKMHMRVKPVIQDRVATAINNVRVGTSPAMKHVTGGGYQPLQDKKKGTQDEINENFPTVIAAQLAGTSIPGTTQIVIPMQTGLAGGTSGTTTFGLTRKKPITQILQTTSGKHIILTPSVVTNSNQRLVLNKNQNILNKQMVNVNVPFMIQSTISGTTGLPVSTTSSLTQPFATALIQHVKQQQNSSQIFTPVVKTVAAELDTNEEKPEESEFYLAEKEKLRKEYRQNVLKLLSESNLRKCSAYPVYGSDLRNQCSCIKLNLETEEDADRYPFVVRSHNHCREFQSNDWSLRKMIKSIEERTRELLPIFSKYVLFVPPVSAHEPQLVVSHMHPSLKHENKIKEQTICREFAPKTELLHPIASAMCTQFPDPRLIQYDCGKLQSLDGLLRKLKTGSHRALIFTQMTRMLDVLEAFLNHHGHIYLRLDGTTKVEQRQLLMERFNEDKRIFVFILSTRSGGVGINLTGADTVIFYDSDWNPTMDAQAQDRCHRIGQTRDVHIYRLVSEKTIEENILKKANQKRLLGDLAIEGGNFTTAYFKSSTIQDLFEVDANNDDPTSRLSEIVERDKERKERLAQNLGSTSSAPTPSPQSMDMGAFESALAAAEDDQDVQAATTAKAEAAADLAEFDENIPITEENREPELSKAEKEVQNLIKQLSPIERYAMRFVEETEGTWTAVQLKAVEMEIENQKREWEANRLAALKKEEEERQRQELEENESMISYSRDDALNKIWISENTKELMPIWAPPTPPEDESDLYVDYSLCFLYDISNVMPESQLPAVYVKKEQHKRTRTEAGFFADGRRPAKMRKEDSYYAPRSLFDRPSPALLKMRRDLKMNRHRGILRSMPMSNLKQQMPVKQLIEPEGMVEWFIYEDMAILNVIQNLQGLPLNLMLLCPGHTPNWDLVADIVNQTSRTYRSPKQCRYRYEAVIVPREEGKLLESPKKQKKNKNPLKNPLKNSRAMRTSQLFTSDNNNSFTKLAKMKFDYIKAAMAKKQPPAKSMLVNSSLKNPKHVSVLQDHGITNYDNPPSPYEIAMKRYERLTKEKQKTLANQQSVDGQTTQVTNTQIIQQQTLPQQQQQQQILKMQQLMSQQATLVPQQTATATQVATHQPQTIIQQQQNTISQSNATAQQLLTQQAIVVQQSPNANLVGQQQTQQTITALVPSNIQQQRVQGQTTQIIGQQNLQSGQQQIMKAIVATPNQQGIVTGTIQQLSSSTQQQLQQHSQSGLHTTAVSVVLTSSPSTVSTVVAQPQIVSIQPSGATAIMNNTSTIVTQATTGSLVQTLSSQSVPQIVTLSSQNLRPQRIMTPKLVLNRPGAPTVVSVSGLGQNLTQAQLQGNQLKLSLDNNQQFSGIVKGIPVTGKSTTTPQIQFYRQQAVRQQLKVLHATASGDQSQGTSATIVQTAGQSFKLPDGSTGTLIQASSVGQAIQAQSGQKVTVATINPGNSGVSAGQQQQQQQQQLVDGNQSGTSTVIAGSGGNVTVQVSTGTPQTIRPQFKQLTATGKPTITRQVVDPEMQLLMKRQTHGQQQQKAQIISTSPQTQIFSPANIQVGQNAGTGTQQITTLVKTSGAPSGSGTASGNTIGTVGMTLSQVKQGTLKGPVANQNDSRFLALQPVTFTQQRKGATGKLTQIAQVSGKGGTQLIVQNPKTIPNTVTVQQLPHVLRHATQMATGQIVLGKGSLGRIIPVSVSTQTNRTQTFQVVSATSGTQVLTSNLRAAHGTAQGLPNNPGIIKVTQQAAQLLSAQGGRQNASPIRLQTNSSGSLVVVSPQTQQQQPQQQQSGTVTIQQDSSGSSGQQSQQIIQQNQQTQQIQISQQSPQPSTQQQPTQNQQQTQQQPQQQQQQVSMMKRK